MLPQSRSEIWRVATLNIWNRQGPWDKRRPLIRAWLEAVDADVVGLQEILSMPGAPSMASELVADLGWHVYDGPAWAIGGGLGFGNAIVSRWPLRACENLALPTPPGLETRACAFALVDAPHGPLPVFCTHLTFQLHLGHVRVQQVRAIAEAVARLAPAAAGGAPPVILGDFNAEPESDEMRYLRGLTGLGGDCVYFADCALAVDDGDRGPTYARDNRFALQAHEPSRRIDYILVRGPDRALRGEPLACRRALVAPVDGVWASDHYAVVADLAAAPRAHDR